MPSARRYFWLETRSTYAVLQIVWPMNANCVWTRLFSHLCSTLVSPRSSDFGSGSGSGKACGDGPSEISDPHRVRKRLASSCQSLISADIRDAHAQKRPAARIKPQLGTNNEENREGQTSSSGKFLSMATSDARTCVQCC